jgi:OmpA-OmpF porin, OOP family
MAMFDALIDDVAGRFGLGPNAGPLIREILATITGSPGGVSGFLNTLKSSGLSSDVASWLGQTNATPFPASQLDRALGSNVLNGVANRLGLAPALVSTAVGYALPKAIGLLTPSGVIPTSLPAEVTNFLSQPPAHGASTPPPAQAARRRFDVYHTPDARSGAMTRWLGPLLAALVLVALGLFFWPTGNRVTTVPPPVAQTPPAAPAPPTVAQAPRAAPTPPTVAQAPPAAAPPTAAQAPPAAPAPPTAAQAPPAAPAPSAAVQPPSVTINNEDGLIHVSGAVHDDETKNTILNALKAAFGADWVQSDIGVDPNRGPAPWLVNFPNSVDSLNTPGVRVVFDGNSVDVGGAVAVADRDRIAASLRSALGGSLVFGTHL